jgi:hypothetical protein
MPGIKRALSNGIIPLVNLNPSDNVDPGTGTTHCTLDDWEWWESFGYWFSRFSFGDTSQWPNQSWVTNPPLYIELGNEMNDPGSHKNYSNVYDGLYASDFGLGAYWMHSYLNGSWNLYHILTGGVTIPYDGDSNCESLGSNLTLSVTQQAIMDALDLNVPYGVLGAAVHPYGYENMQEDGGQADPYWGNTYQQHTYRSDGSLAQWTGNACSQIGPMVDSWRSTLSGLAPLNYTGYPFPLVFTEINFQAGAGWGHESEQWDSNLNGYYMADLFTWIADKYAYNRQSSELSTYPLRVMWFSTVDDIHRKDGGETPYLGIFERGSLLKWVNNTGNPPGPQVPLICQNLPSSDFTSKGVPLDKLFSFLTGNACF